MVLLLVKKNTADATICLLKDLSYAESAYYRKALVTWAVWLSRGAPGQEDKKKHGLYGSVSDLGSF